MKVHENLPSASFDGPPQGIVQATICSRSGKLPIPGLCDGTLRTEYFAEGTVPTDPCNVHYQGAICAYTGLAASAPCPFKAEGIFELIPPEPTPLLHGSSTLGGGNTQTAPDGSTVVGSENPATPEEGQPAGTPAINYCPHNEAFMADPNSEAIINAQRAELQQAAAAAAPQNIPE